jgi:HAMP domain-containing protein
MLSPAGRGSAPVRPVVIGGVLTSAAISLAGVAFVAWRRTHPGLDPMTRAVRSVARTKVV